MKADMGLPDVKISGFTFKKQVIHRKVLLINCLYLYFWFEIESITDYGKRTQT
jgi:hypothetical protein